MSDLRIDMERAAHAKTRADTDRKIHALKADLAEERSTKKHLLDRVEELEVELGVYAKVIDDLPKIGPVRAMRKAGGDSESTMIALASDWHVDELVEPGQVGSLNEYNPDIAKARAARFSESVVRVARMNREHTEIRTLILWLGGDFITGHIHEENYQTTIGPPLVTIKFASELIADQINFMLDHGGFDRIICPCNFGNHGRNTAKPYYSKAAEHNYEWFMYVQLAKLFENEPRIQFSVTKARYNREVEIYGRRVNFHHGEDLKFSGGLQGTFGRLYKKHQEWSREVPCYLSFVGHWHQCQYFHNLGGINGSLIGYNAYAAGRFPFEPPQQLFTLIERDRGMTLAGPLYVE